MDIIKFEKIAKELLLEYVIKCVNIGGLEDGWLEDHDFDIFISNRDRLKPTDRIEIYSTVSPDTRYSVFYNSNRMMLDVLDTSA